MKRTVIGITVALASALLFGVAFADSTHTCQGNSCNDAGGASSASSATGVGIGVGVGIGQGGSATATAQGGKGGDGGSAAVIGSGNSSNVNLNGATAVQGQHQGQKQDQKNKQTTSVSVDASSGDVPRQAPPAIAPGMSVGTFVCRASVVVGASTPFGGVSGGYPMRDETCEQVTLALALNAMGDVEVARELLNADERVAKAREAVAKRSGLAPGVKPASVDEKHAAMVDNRPQVAKTALQEKLEQIQGM